MYIVKGKIGNEEKSVTVDTLGQARHVANALNAFGVADVSASVEKTVSLEKKVRPAAKVKK